MSDWCYFCKDYDPNEDKCEYHGWYGVAENPACNYYEPLQREVIKNDQ